MCSTQIFWKVRLVSEEFSAHLESRFFQDKYDIDLKFVRELEPQNLPLSHPMALALAIHTARISSRISQNNALLAQYLSNKSSIPISSMMAILLRAAGDLVFFMFTQFSADSYSVLLNATPSLCKSKVWNSESFALTGIGLKRCFKNTGPSDQFDATM